MLKKSRVVLPQWEDNSTDTEIETNRRKVGVVPSSELRKSALAIGNKVVSPTEERSCEKGERRQQEEGKNWQKNSPKNAEFLGEKIEGFDGEKSVTTLVDIEANIHCHIAANLRELEKSLQL